MTPAQGHVPVLLAEVLAALDPQPGQAVLDCTAGLGGHARAMAQRIGPSGTLVLMDLDPTNLACADATVRSDGLAPRIVAMNAPFSAAPRLLADRGIVADCVLADLGWSSNQIADSARGFSFQRAGPLDMRLDPAAPVTAAELVATLPEGELAQIIRDYGEDPAAGRIARAIVRARAAGPIATTDQLARVVHEVMPRRHGPGGGIDPATRTFQALRIAVNDELGHLDALLAAVRRAATSISDTWLRAATADRPGARVAIIAFHSLEDRPVKQAFAALAADGVAATRTRGAVQASEAEVQANPRARSARLRAVELTRAAR
ncbi:MAG: 16S rRNA (cytosine(1402)-N(4))-methyltransferase RsmH [Phycisphaeraceae bacterium]|nr:16S rRNA (cytosine(1402)-N(4))-methyltransferase RsmH [Phycisphaeraceae bacterium]